MGFKVPHKLTSLFILTCPTLLAFSQALLGLLALGLLLETIFSSLKSEMSFYSSSDLRLVIFKKKKKKTQSSLTSKVGSNLPAFYSGVLIFGTFIKHARYFRWCALFPSSLMESILVQMHRNCAPSSNPRHTKYIG